MTGIWCDSCLSMYTFGRALLVFPPEVSVVDYALDDIKRDIDPDSIVRLDLGFGTKGQTGRIIVDKVTDPSPPPDGFNDDFDFSITGGP